MAKNREMNKEKIILSLCILIGVLAVFASIILCNGGVILKKTNYSEVINKLKVLQAKGGNFQLTQKDIDEISNLYFVGPKNKGDITLKGVNIEMFNNEILIKAPISYKKINLLLSSRGKLEFTNGRIEYVANNFKVGKLTLPKSLVCSQISKLNVKNLYVEDNLIKINPSAFPFKINNFKIMDNKILGTATKLDIVDRNVQSYTGNVNTVDSEKKKELDKIRAEVEKSKQAVVKNEQETTVEKEKDTQDQIETKRASLTKVNGELKGAYSQVDSPKEKQVLSKMILTVGKLKSDPSYDSTSDQASVKSIYRTLDSDSQNRIKIALFMNVDSDSIPQLRQSFGL